MKTALLIEDDEILVMHYTGVLEELGFARDNISTALNGKEALEAIPKIVSRPSLPDLILLDLEMPVMDGFAFLEAYRKLPDSKKTRIIIISSSIDPDELDRAATFGAYQYITKPLRKEVLESMLK